MSRPHFTRHFAFVTLLHAVLVGGLFLVVLIPGLDSRKPVSPLTELVVEIPPGTEAGTDDYDPADTAPAPPSPPAEDVAPPEPEPEATKVIDRSAIREPPKSDRRPAPTRETSVKSNTRTSPKVREGKPAIQRSTRKIRNPFGRADGKPPKKPLTAAQIKALLNAGAKAGDHTTEVDDETLYLDTVRTQLYRAWVQPSSINIDGLSTKVDIELGLGGALLDSSIVKSSGNAVMDESVRRALDSIRRIPGLPAWFVARHSHMQVLFKLTEDTR